MKYFLLFLGPGPDSLHHMAEGLARKTKPQDVTVVSMAMLPSPPHPDAQAVMNTYNIDISTLEPRTPIDIELFSFDLVITLGDYDSACRPNLPGMPPHYHWELPPETPHPGIDSLGHYRFIAKNLEKRVNLLFHSQMLRGLSMARRNFELVLDNLAHAVMAHTINRRIFHFNQAAELITGYKREELLGKDCHEVFKPQRFCGGDCLFCKSSASKLSVPPSRKRQVPFTHKNGGERILDMTINPLRDVSGIDVGALVSFSDNTELHALKRRIRRRKSLQGLVGSDPKMSILFEQIKEVSVANVPVLIQGESGTGKELIAQAVHLESARAKKAFVPVNCGALPEGILESELFGHVRGAFTGAVHDKKGRFELADGGTLFLDEVAELSMSMQVKLLRVLQEQCFERVGGERRIHVDVRLLSATNQDLRKLMERGQFRRDLFYRLCVVPISPPSLRERLDDIPLLVDHFLAEIAKQIDRKALTVTDEAIDILMAYSWPGNVRELRNVIEYAHVKCRTGQIDVHHLPAELHEERGKRPSSPGKRGPRNKLDPERVSKAMVMAEGNKSQAAKILGVGRTTLYRFLMNSDV